MLFSRILKRLRSLGIPPTHLANGVRATSRGPARYLSPARSATLGLYRCFLLSRSGRSASSQTWLTNDSELESMISEAPGPINFTMFLTIFGDRITGVDDEEVIVNAFSMFDQGNGFCTEERLRQMLCTFGEKLTDQEANDAFAEAPINSEGKVDLKKFASILTKGVEEEQGA
ncbi:myosin regulatory light chain, putative [Ixodes scapularis]|uniref:Myosin regulatory light chain, putative n=1 Tax=Ixodes scapularis TaxID=6945 RepID=B7PAY1_IXOSC|nr:myosin regulatory light chain, putative [Ixodes scapularis]|eukprot:XP_002407408.1 myosin regulatory light chain, putative [Ixodes scapularis]